MKLHPDASPQQNTVTGYGAGYIEINQQRFEHSLLVMADTPVQAWPPSTLEALDASHFEMLAALAPEVVVFGSGAKLRFPHPRLFATLTARRIGVETMDTQAACRTYNILISEGRRVAAALLIEPTTETPSPLVPTDGANR
ncbi:MAG: Mth938-like domain-containing protein [Janthinobacterium lividum]